MISKQEEDGAGTERGGWMDRGRDIGRRGWRGDRATQRRACHTHLDAEILK